MSELIVSFVGTSTRLSVDASLTFGREADICVDENPYLHRRLGLFRHEGGNWWLENIGGRIPIEVIDSASRSLFVLAPGASAALTFSHSVVRFEVAGSTYELDIELVQEPAPVRPVANDPNDSSLVSQTIGLASLPLTDDQRRILVVLCESVLRDSTAKLTIPTNRIAASRLGWTNKAYGRKLDNVCDRLTRIGVRGLRGDSATVAKDRRLVLAVHAIDAELISKSDLGLLP